MHILLEGAIPYEISLMLKSFIWDENYFTLEQLNDRIDCFPYSYEESRDKPSHLKANLLTSKSTNLGQSGELVNTLNQLSLHDCTLMLSYVLQIICSNGG